MATSKPGVFSLRSYLLPFVPHLACVTICPLKDFAEELAEEGRVSDGELLREVHRLLQQRSQSFGRKHMPSCLPEEVVWASFRNALMNVEYWLSIQEIQFIAVYFGARLHVYVWKKAASLQLQDLEEDRAALPITPMLIVSA